MNVSVILCTHNPRADYLARVMEGLQRQTLPRDQWELIVIDNASQEPVRSDLVSWHPRGRVLVERELGLTPARLRAIRQTTGKLLVFVDDDAVLAPDYLEQALAINREHPQMGAFGGNIALEPEVAVPACYKHQRAILAERTVIRDKWGCLYLNEITPCGVGLVVQRRVAARYLESLTTTARALGRRGDSLTSGEDNDLAYTACDLGLAMGMFARLRLTHLIPKERLTEEYMLRLIEAMSYSSCLLGAMRGSVDEDNQIPPLTVRLLNEVLRGRFSWKVAWAKWRGLRRAARELRAGRG